MPTPVKTPVQTPTTNPDATPWHEEYTDPERLCPQQGDEQASPQVMP